MAIGVDSSALLAIIRPDPDGQDWLDLLMALGAVDRLVACDVVLAEVAPFFDDLAAMIERLAALGVEFDPITPATAFRAGEIYSAYRRAGGPRQTLIPDFLIGAHALEQGAGLVASDRGYLRSHFRGLKVFQPEKR